MAIVEHRMPFFTILRMMPYAIKFFTFENGFRNVYISSWGNKTAIGWLLETVGYHPPNRVTKEEMWEIVYENDPKCLFAILAILRK